MRFSNLLPLALSASAFLIPAEINEDVAMINKIPSSAKTETVELECDGGCPVALDKGSKNGSPRFFTQLYPGKLVADVSVEGSKVLFNGQQIWPRTMSPGLSIKQTTKGDTYTPFSGLIPVSSSLDYKPDEILVDSHNHMTIHPITIDVLSLGDKVVHAESVEIRIAETDVGLGLLPSRIRPYESSPYTDKCTTVWCRVKGTIAKKFDEFRHAATKKIGSWRGCQGQKHGLGRKPGHKINGLPIKGGPAKFGPGSTLHPHLHHGHHGHHGHHRGGFVGHMVAFVRHIFIPVFFGLVTGLMFGSVLFIIVNRLRQIRAARSEYIVVEQIEAEEGRADGPPKYDEIYREPQDETTDEKKELLQ